MKNCPFCAEEIQEEAIKCRYCGEWLGAKPELHTPDPVPPVPQKPEPQPLINTPPKFEKPQQRDFTVSLQRLAKGGAAAGHLWDENVLADNEQQAIQIAQFLNPEQVAKRVRLCNADAQNLKTMPAQEQTIEQPVALVKLQSVTGKEKKKALMNCPACNNQVSSIAAACPHCGEPIAEAAGSKAVGAPLTTVQETSKKLKAHTLFSLIILFVFAAWLFAAFAAKQDGGNLAIPGILSLSGFVWYAVTRFRIWWHHK